MRGKTRSCDKLFTQNVSGRSDSLYFKNREPSFICFSFYMKSKYCVYQKKRSSIPSFTVFQTDSAESSSMGGFPMHHNGTCSTFPFTFWRPAKVLPSSLWSAARDLVPNTHLEENSLRRSTTKEEELVRSWKIFSTNPPYIISLPNLWICAR